MPAPAPPHAEPAIPVSGAPWTTSLLVDHPLVGRIYRPADGAFVARSDVETALRKARFVLLGEKHDNPDHHRLQLQLLDVVLEGERRPALVLEMLDTAVDGILASFLASGSQDADALAEAVSWNKKGWDWELYRPLIARGLQKKLPIVAANLSRKLAGSIIKEGREAQVLKDLGELPALSEAQLAALDQEIRDSHCGMLPESMVGGMALAQRARDATIGAVLRRSGATADGAVLIAGGGHVRADRGAPLALRAPRQQLLVVSIVEVFADAEEPAAYLDDAAGTDAYDFVWFTPRLDDDDPCDRLRGHFDKPASKG